MKGTKDSSFLRISLLATIWKLMPITDLIPQKMFSFNRFLMDQFKCYTMFWNHIWICGYILVKRNLVWVRVHFVRLCPYSTKVRFWPCCLPVFVSRKQYDSSLTERTHFWKVGCIWLNVFLCVTVFSPISCCQDAWCRLLNIRLGFQCVKTTEVPFLYSQSRILNLSKKHLW